MASCGKFDFSEFEKLGKNMQAAVKAWPAFLEDCIRDVALILLAKTVKRTPVDTGELRRAWTVGPVRKTAAGYEVELYNPTGYGMYVEFGHRLRKKEGWGWVEGRFMMTISEQELERELPAILDKRMQRFLDRFMG